MISQSIALNYLAAGLSVLPARKKEKCPAFKWKEYQERLPTACEITAWFANNHDAVCIVCGKVSGNLEVIDFDNHGELFPKWKCNAPHLSRVALRKSGKKVCFRGLRESVMPG